MGANVQPSDASERMRKAIERGDFGIVLSLLIAGVDVNATDKNGRTPLFSASAYGNSHICGILLQQGAFVNGRSREGWTPLRVATKYGHAKVVKLLLEKGANEYEVLDKSHKFANEGYGAYVFNKEIKEVFGRFPLYAAARRGDYHFCEKLLKDGTNTLSSQTDFFSPLKGAIQNGSLEIVKLLLLNGANINERFLSRENYSAVTPIRFAVENGQTNVVQLFLGPRDSAYSVDQLDTLLILAAEKKYGDIVRILMDKGAHVDSQKSGTTVKVDSASQYSKWDIDDDSGPVSLLVNDATFESFGCVCTLKTRLNRINETVVEEGPISVLDSDDVEELEKELFDKQISLSNIVLQINGMVVDLKRIQKEFDNETDILKDLLEKGKRREQNLRNVVERLRYQIKEVNERNQRT